MPKASDQWTALEGRWNLSGILEGGHRLSQYHVYDVSAYQEGTRLETYENNSAFLDLEV